MVNRINNNDYYDYSKLKMPDAADKADNGEKFSLNYQRAQEEKEDKDKKEKTEETGESVKINPRTVMQGGVRLELSRNGQSASETERSTAGRTSSSGQGLMNTVLTWVRGFIQVLKDFLYKVWNDEAPPGSILQDDENAGKTDVLLNAEAAQSAVADGNEDVAQSAGIIDNVGAMESVKADRGVYEADWYGTGQAGDIMQPERVTEEYLALKELESLQNPELAALRQMQREAVRNKEIQKYLKSGDLEQVLSLVTDHGRRIMAKNSSLLTYYDRTGKITTLSASDQERILHGDRNVKKL